MDTRLKKGVRWIVYVLVGLMVGGLAFGIPIFHACSGDWRDFKLIAILLGCIIGGLLLIMGLIKFYKWAWNKDGE